ncbi:uncharacterized protein [Arachis hypogaea]|uniref:uncharacterized protein n=1 Tax=Arachis hypogaea TaxID=3818 RepID=UPI003B224C99
MGLFNSSNVLGPSNPLPKSRCSVLVVFEELQTSWTRLVTGRFRINDAVLSFFKKKKKKENPTRDPFIRETEFFKPSLALTEAVSSSSTVLPPCRRRPCCRPPLLPPSPCPEPRLSFVASHLVPILPDFSVRGLEQLAIGSLLAARHPSLRRRWMNGQHLRARPSQEVTQFIGDRWKASDLFIVSAGPLLFMAGFLSLAWKLSRKSSMVMFGGSGKYATLYVAAVKANLVEKVESEILQFVETITEE